jgi:hypothetical protein
MTSESEIFRCCVGPFADLRPQNELPLPRSSYAVSLKSAWRITISGVMECSATLE